MELSAARVEMIHRWAIKRSHRTDGGGRNIPLFKPSEGELLFLARTRSRMIRSESITMTDRERVERIWSKG